MKTKTMLRGNVMGTVLGIAMSVASAAALVNSAVGAAESNTFSAKLSASAEVPANNSPGTGTLDATLDPATRTLSWKMTFIGLTGPATAAHFHGPAMPGANAGVAVPFPSAVSPLEGKATLTPAQVADLVAGKWYANVHTAMHPDGEIRGQVTQVK